MLQRFKGSTVGRQVRKVVLASRRRSYPTPQIPWVRAMSLEAERLHVLVCYPSIGDLDPHGLAPYAQLEDENDSACEEPSSVVMRQLCEEHDGTRSLTVLLSLKSPVTTIPQTLRVSDATGHLPSATFPLGERVLADLARDSIARFTPAEADVAYDAWFRAHKTSDEQLAAQRSQAEAMEKDGPLFSVVVPLYHTPVPYLRQMAQSVLDQTYGKLELVLVNSTPRDEGLHAAVEELAASDERVRVVELEHNLGISLNTKAGVDVSQGEFVCFFDHDDLLEPDVLFEYAHAIADEADTDLLYCDEDLLVEGTYERPAFKSDWSLAQEETNNYVCHMLTVRRNLIDGFFPCYDGAQDHRLSLVVGRDARNVSHVPKVLYHWRAHPGSTANSASAKAESFEAGRLAIQDHLDALGLRGTVESIPTMPHCYRFVLDFDEPPLVSAVVMGRDEGDAIARANGLRNILTWPNLELVPQVAELGPSYADAVSEGIARANGEYVLVVANDVVVQSPDLVEQLLSLATRSGHAVAGAKVLNPDGTVQAAGMTLQARGAVRIGTFLAWHYGTGKGYLVLPHDLSAVSGECVLARRDLFQKADTSIHGLDETNWAVALCILAARMGLGTCIAPMAHVGRPLPAGAAPLSPDEAERDAEQQRLLLSRFPEEFSSPDPFYSRHLTDDGLFRLREDKD